MSREDAQFKLRMPAELRSKVEQAAKSAGRSINAELVARLEASYLSEDCLQLIPANKARELSELARSALPNEIRRRVIGAINHAIKMGHSSTVVNLSDFELDVGLSDPDAEHLISGITEELITSGYKYNWDDMTAIFIEF